MNTYTLTGSVNGQTQQFASMTIYDIVRLINTLKALYGFQFRFSVFPTQGTIWNEADYAMLPIYA